MPGYDRPDYWTLRAKKEGYPARSVYKLEEIMRKFGLLKVLDGRTTEGGPDQIARPTRPRPSILDVGAAPGSWSLWLLRQMKGAGQLVAVDVQDLGIAPRDANFSFLKGNILDDAVRAALRDAGPFQLIVSDAAPATSGNRLVDQARSEELVEAVMGLAPEVLAPGSALIMKIFQGGEERRLLSELRAHFAQARTFKPEACRSESFETYLVATGFARRD
ncbi:Ribosomal RNA large subunit methyltransferase E [uncultured spirochete]|jgi:23S rRNA (uridine2552-2'-O)-methyltransferase|uniref:Ribosomal RNA large subunit methyltransferase E n=1 Tax=uncultured spirochete TaxID=156406 RepID=A0A3P3XN87_9SPIR|nr:Ribosomal RNA large subunit methyltransferase E [uncultured spirochete]